MSQQEAGTTKKLKVAVPSKNTATARSSSSSDDRPPIPELLALPEVPLQGVISNIPLQSLITTVPLLHSRLLTFREIALRQNRHLTLYIGAREAVLELKSGSINDMLYSRHLIDPTTGKPLYPEASPFHRLYLATLGLSTVLQLAKLMPDISHLEIFIAGTDILQIPNLIHLLTLWSPSLLSLKLHARFSNDASTPQELSVIGYLLRRLIESINATLSSLVHLTLDLSDRLFEANQVTVSLAMPILGQLREFYFNTEDDPFAREEEFIVETLRTYARETALKDVYLGFISFGAALLEAFPAGTHLASTMVDGNFELVPAYEADEATCLLQARFLRTFTNLRKQTVSLFPSRPLSALPALLAHLSQLTSLHLVVTSPGTLSLLDAHPNWRRLLAPLGSVRILQITLTYPRGSTEASHLQTGSPLWAHLFPSVQILQLHHSTAHFCTLCRPDSEWRNANPIGTESMRPLLPCIKQYLAPFTVLPSLRKMFYSRAARVPFAEFNSMGDFIQIIRSPT